MVHRPTRRKTQFLPLKRAVLLGSDAAELDVRRTLDGVLVVHHNATLDDGQIISQVKYSELPDHVCTLDEALDACVPMWVNVEIKNDPKDPNFDASESIADQTIKCLERRPEEMTVG